MCQTKTNVQNVRCTKPESPTETVIDIEFCFIKFYPDQFVFIYVTVK